MMVLTLQQPYAQLISDGVKWVETRPWLTHYRGRALIHAGTSTKNYEHGYAGWYLGKHPLCDVQQTPRGAIVASCKLESVLPILEGTTELALAEPRPCVVPHGNELSIWTGSGYEGESIDDQLPYGDFTPGFFAWILKDIKSVEERCPACWGKGYVPQLCEVCGGDTTCDPLPVEKELGL